MMHSLKNLAQSPFKMVCLYYDKSGEVMATNFKFTRGESKQHEAKEYTIEREYKKEARKVAALEKELKKHEKTDMAHAHPPRSHEASQKSAPLPNMRKY
jgi:hypothetical protein